ncbi:MAG: nucleotidyltransferase family protein [Chlorobium sp.]|jgi:mannose-1-phosphate guanylyltransferase|nr:nucleotidyltransferase family protein [Chlorobium sp.]
MRAMLLAAGCGTRLRPLTKTTPKCLVPIQGTPLLEIWLNRLTKASIGPFLINTHYLPEQVVNFIEGSPYRNQVTLVHEQTLMGTAGTLINNLEYFEGEDGLLIHADNYCLADFLLFVQAHQKRPPECVMTMMTFRTDTPSTCGIVELDERGVVIGFHEKVNNPPGNIANGAIYILSKEFISKVKTDYSCAKDFSCDILPKNIGKINTYLTNAKFLDIGSVTSYNAANK